MVRNIKIALALAALAFTCGLQPSVQAQGSMKHAGETKTLATGTFHGKVHKTSSRATVYQESDGKLVLRLTHFKTSNGPDVHAILIAAKDADDDANFLNSSTERVELGNLKGNEGDSEPAPFAASTDPQPLYTGRLEGKAHQTSGRGTIYKTSDGRQYLRLTDFSTSNGPDVHVILARSDDENLTQDIVKGQLDSVELGSLKGNQGDQNYDLPASVDLQKYNAAVIYCERFHAIFGVARLEQF